MKVAGKTGGAVRLIITILLAAALVYTGFIGRNAYAEEKNVVAAYESTNVLDDLKNSTIAGESFDLSDYPYKANGDAQLITFVEYCYSPVKDKQSDYGLYAYIYNPQQTAYDESDRNKIQFSYGNAQTAKYEKYTLRVLNYSTQAGYEGLFWKFKVELTSTQLRLILAKISPSERKYKISGIELSRQGKVTEYPATQEYTYRGYASGYGTELSETSSLSCTVDGYTDFAQFDVTHTVYRPQGDYYRGDQSQLNSCFFSVPNTLLENNGELTSVVCEWYEHMLKPVLVTEDYNVYQQLNSLRGAPLSELTGKYAFLCQAIGNVRTYNWDKLFVLLSFYGALLPGYSDYDTYGWASNIPIGESYGWAAWYDFAEGTQVYKSNFPPELNFGGFSAVFYTGGTPYPYEQTSVTPAQLQEKLLTNSAALGDNSIAGRYAKQLFYGFDEPVDENSFTGYTRETITSSDEKPLSWNTVTKKDGMGALKQFFLGGSGTNNFGNEVVSALVKVTSEDLEGDAETVSKRLKIGKGEVQQLKYEFGRAGNNKTVFICRYSATTYFSSPCGTCLRDVGDKDATTSDDRVTMARNVLKQNRNLDGLSPSSYIAIETVQLDFDIIELEFTKDGVTTVIPVVSSPTDAIGGISPPLEEVKPVLIVPWWAWVLIVAAIVVVVVIVALILICVFVPGAAPVIGKGLLTAAKGILYGIYYLFYGLFWVVSLPFRGIAFLYKKMKKRLYEKGKQKEYVRQQKLNRKASMEVARYQNTLVRKEQVRQDKLKFKDEVKAEQRKSKQATKSANKRKKKSAKQRKKGGKKK